MFTTEGKHVHIKAWVDVDEFYSGDASMFTQTQNLATLPFAYHHVALMPDAHGGYGMPIGGVLATTGTVIPNAVGGDAGCGMLAVDFGEHVEDFMADRNQYLIDVNRVIPTGMNRRKVAVLDFIDDMEFLPTDVIKDEFETAAYSLGTLGGGNHFIEFDKDERNHLWLVIHSGSRHLGQTLNKHYNSVAKEMNAKYSSCVPPSYDLAFLPTDTQDGQDYMDDMNWCVDYAMENRRAMLNGIRNVLEFPTKEIETVHTRHNYATMENHYGKNVLVHRKGAVRARKDELVVIPGSMGSRSYIARGLGNKDSFESCSHGAGRPMSRTAAKKLISVEDYTKEMKDLDIALVTNSDNVADESRGAYKDVDLVMMNQCDLVDKVHTLIPLGVVKG